MRGVAVPREPAQEIGIPEPAVAVAAMHEQQRRPLPVALGPAGRKTRTQFEVQLDGKHFGKGPQMADGPERRGVRAGHRSRRRNACYDGRAMRALSGKAAILPEAAYDPECRRCPRLASFLDAVRAEHSGYFCRPVPPFGAQDARLVIVGLAPGMQGANASGRPFTGDYAGILLYETLHAYGFASRGESTSCDDGLLLIDCRITNAVKCLPPANKPTPDEVRACNGFLAADLATLPAGGALLALGRSAAE